MGIGAGAYPLASYIHGIKNGQDTGFLNEMVRESLFIMKRSGNVSRFSTKEDSGAQASRKRSLR